MQNSNVLVYFLVQFLLKVGDLRMAPPILVLFTIHCIPIIDTRYFYSGSSSFSMSMSSRSGCMVTGWEA